MPFIVLANLVAPIWIAPLFNKFEPMQDKALEQQILRSPDRAGIEGSRVFAGEQERRHEDAQRLRRRPVRHQAHRPVGHDAEADDGRELLFVMGHEMGHYVLHHVWQAVAFSCC